MGRDLSRCFTETCKWPMARKGTNLIRPLGTCQVKPGTCQPATAAAGRARRQRGRRPSVPDSTAPNTCHSPSCPPACLDHSRSFHSGPLPTPCGETLLQKHESERIILLLKPFPPLRTSSRSFPSSRGPVQCRPDSLSRVLCLECALQDTAVHPAPQDPSLWRPSHCSAEWPCDSL